ncbi:MAG: metal ABC transporter permease [Candidatus Sumerlaeaceae bacterium]|nr:metal ABC transporter permease [Candidatus Sumerlaeaceae bacterium]
MNLIALVGNLATNDTLQVVALGSVGLGLAGGVLGTFAVLRRQSLLGDAVSHAALPGIVLAFMLTGTKAPLVLVVGAAAAGWLATLAVLAITRHTRIKDDTALGVVLSVFFGFGLVLLTYLQRQPSAAKAGLDRFLFGQAAAMLRGDVVVIIAMGGAAIAVLVAFWKEFKLLAFDPDYAACLGYPVRILDVLLQSLIVAAIVIGLQAVGVVLMSALLVAPAAAARQWTDRLGVMAALAGLFGAGAGMLGAVISSTTEHLPAGPSIVLCASTIVVVSLLAAPNRGIIWQVLRHWRHQRRLGLEALLCDLLELATHHHDPEHGHSLSALAAMSGGRAGLKRRLRELHAKGLVRPVGAGRWTLTAAGRIEAARVAASHHPARHEDGCPT